MTVRSTMKHHSITSQCLFNRRQARSKVWVIITLGGAMIMAIAFLLTDWFLFLVEPTQQVPTQLHSESSVAQQEKAKGTNQETVHDAHVVIDSQRAEKIKAGHFSVNMAAQLKAVTSGKGEFWERTYAQGPACLDRQYKGSVANQTAKEKMTVVPHHEESGWAAGPIIDCQGKNAEDCDPRERMWAVDSYQSVLRGTGHHFRLPNGIGYPTLVLDRTRYSSASSVCFLDKRHLAVASFADHAIYLYEFDIESQNQTLLHTVKARNAIDLINCDLERKRISASLLLQMGADIFHYDLEKKQIQIYKEITVFTEPAYDNDYLHDVAFVPTSDRVIVSATMRGRQSSVHKTLRLMDYETETVLADFNTTLNPITDKHFIKGIRVIDNKHILVAAVPYGVFTVDPGCTMRDKPDPSTLHAILYILRMDFDLDDIIEGRAPRAHNSNFTMVDWVAFPGSTPEQLDYHKGLAISADQINDRHLFFHVDVNGETPLRYAGVFNGCTVSHGAGFNADLDLLGLTCYGDNSVWVHKLSDALSAARVSTAFN